MVKRGKCKIWISGKDRVEYGRGRNGKEREKNKKLQEGRGVS